MQKPSVDETNCVHEDRESPRAPESTVHSELGRLALKARRAYIASGGRLLDRADIEREVANGRGSTHLIDSQ